MEMKLALVRREAVASRFGFKDETSCVFPHRHWRLDWKPQTRVFASEHSDPPASLRLFDVHVLCFPMFAFNNADSRPQTWSRISEHHHSCTILLLFLLFTENIATCETGIIHGFDTFWAKT